MSLRIKRLSRAGRAFEAKGKMLEVRLATLARESREVEDSIKSIRSSLDSPLFHALPLHAGAARRIAELTQRSLALDTEMALLRRERIGAGMRSKLAGQLADTLNRQEAREETEREALELSSAASASSLRQASDD